jgi:hypothetical protein
VSFCSHPLGYNNQFHEHSLNPKVSGLPWRDQWLVRGRARGLPTPPVARAPPMMCHRDYFDIPVTDPIDKTERKVWKEIPTGPVHITRPTLRGFSHSFHTGVDFCCEGLGSNWAPLCVPLHSSFNLDRRCRMKANLDVRHQYAS